MDLSHDSGDIKGKTILITGGASGFGAAFGTRWASAGATVILGDINPNGEEVTAQIRQESKNPNVHFIHLDVTSWTSQVNFFRESLRLSPHGGIDTVVANAGINDHREAGIFENPKVDYLNDPSPPAPNFKTLDVNITGVMYTVHLAMFFLPKNPNSAPCLDATTQSQGQRDRHILLLGSVASLHPLMTQAPYTVSKHGVLGLFRCLRISAPVSAGIRVNIVCPYYTDTLFMQVPPRVLLAGVPLGGLEDVVDAASFLVANKDCIGRSLVTGPKLKLDPSSGASNSPYDQPIESIQLEAIQSKDYEALNGQNNHALQENQLRLMELEQQDKRLKMKARQEEEKQAHDNKVKNSNEDGSSEQEGAVWECYLNDMDPADIFTQRMLTAVHAVVQARGWKGWAYDMASALTWPVRQLWNSRAGQR